MDIYSIVALTLGRIISFRVNFPILINKFSGI